MVLCRAKRQSRALNDPLFDENILNYRFNDVSLPAETIIMPMSFSLEA